MPSGIWRLFLAGGADLGLRPYDVIDGWEAFSTAGLSVVCEGLALLTLGLVRPWGERVTSWLPLIGGRWVAPRAAVLPAAFGAVALAAIWTYTFRDFPDVEGTTFASTGWQVLLIACYLPLSLWAPLLAVVTWAYYRRRCRN
ncbi:hypothetical protein [Amycolatopsis plumensis]|uniref:Uncharacterized protein n=1 Tax=Amycolatopsis plumensis TaxID=236508 RepID=A0ABV5UHY4_9PSEU